VATFKADAIAPLSRAVVVALTLLLRWRHFLLFETIDIGTNLSLLFSVLRNLT